jgi:hypothetical protein
MGVAALAAVVSCHSTNGTDMGTTGGAGGSSAGGGASGAGGGTAGNGGTTGAGGSTTGTGGTSGAGGGTSGTGGGSSGTGGATSAGGSGGVVMCTPGVKSALITDCGYPMSSSTPLSSVVFNESEVLRAIQPEGGAPTGIVRVFYNDEHAMTLGVRQVVVKGASGMTTTDYPVTALSSNPGSATNPQTGTNELVGPQSGLDQSLRPMWPALFITDITKDPNSRAGDWQYGGRPLSPNAVFGSWKAAVRTVDATVMPNKIVITPDPDPMKNNWSLGGGDQPPAGLTSQGYGAEARWQVPLENGHDYRIQVMVHDGDQNKAGGDSGEACVLFCAGGTAGTGGMGGSGGSGGADAGAPPMCPSGSAACGSGGIDPVRCNAGTVCANGCCIPLIP